MSHTSDINDENEPVNGDMASGCGMGLNLKKSMPKQFKTLIFCRSTFYVIFSKMKKDLRRD